MLRTLGRLLGLGLVGWAAGCGGDGSNEGGGEAPGEDAEYARRLRLAVDQLRRHLAQSAEAELAWCTEARPGDPEPWFHRARLELLPGRAEPAVARALARELLGEVLVRDAGHVGAHRILYELARDQNDDATAQTHGDAIRAAYGPLAEVELHQLGMYRRFGVSQGLLMDAQDPTHQLFPDYQRLMNAFGSFQRKGAYNPGFGAAELEILLNHYDELAGLRHQYARTLDYNQVRLATPPDSHLPPISSEVSLDLARRHVVLAYDRVAPSTRLATDLLRHLGRLALQMAEYDDAVLWYDLALKDERLSTVNAGSIRIAQGVARYKQGRHREALELYAQGPRTVINRWLQRLAQRSLPADQRPPLVQEFRLREDFPQLEADEVPPFVDVAAALGVNKLDGLGPSAWADVDRDGDHDLFVCGADSYGMLLLDEGERFRDATREMGLERVQSGFSATLVDVHGDGLPDLYLGRDGWNGPAPNALYRNTGEGFEDVTAGSGAGDRGSSFVHLWSDVDRDGDLDLYVANGITGGPDTNALYTNRGEGTFADGTQAAGLTEPVPTRTIGVAVGDYDDDGWPDLFCSGYQTLNRLYHNEGKGVFREVAREAGVDGRAHIGSGYVAFFADFDGDLDLDILRTSLAPWEDVLNDLKAPPSRPGPTVRRNVPRLYLNQGGGRFSDGTEAAGLVHPIGIMGAGVADLDNDGWLDLVFGTGDPDVARLEPDRYFHNLGGGRFTDRTFVSGLDNLGKGHGVTFIDRDGDGDLEIYMPEGGFVHGDPWPNAYYDNRLDAGNAWLHVELEGQGTNRDAIGARVVVRAGDLALLRVMNNGEGFGSTNSKPLEFGLGKAEAVDALQVRWPDGEEQAFEDVPLNARILLRQGEEAWARR